MASQPAIIFAFNLKNFVKWCMSMASFKSSPPSSSSSIQNRKWTYDVFLSFRGEDTRCNFVDHLYAALVQKGIHTFKDDEMLQRGKAISPELLKAIEESRFAVVVFSENYACSSWCLDELAKIMECQDRMGQKVLPVFYHVDPSDVRGQKRDFATAFQQHEVKFRDEMDKVRKWRKALVAAANLSGWHISAVNGGEYTFIIKIVLEVLGGIQPRSMENSLIGIESHMEALNSLLRIEAIEEVIMVGICGMGGIGKTTIAQALFKRIAYKFEGNSFVKDVTENSSSNRDICALQERILRDILVAHHGFLIQDPEYGADIIRERFCNKKVLLVLDDVNSTNQLEFLAATHEWFGAGSRIIITTRNEHVLSYTNAKYKPALLRMDQAVELFCRHAFRKDSPLEGYEELSNRAIRYTGRLPLALKVLGSFFHGRQAGVWGSALNRLAKTPNREIFDTLKLSFDGLEVSEKKMFLDIACFFKGSDEERVTKVLDSFGFEPLIGISVLIEKSLVTISKKRLDMHDLLQEMGRKIVSESFPNSRLWQPEEIHDLIRKKRELEAIEAVVLLNKLDNLLEYGEEGFSADVFECLKNLRLLDVGWRFTYCEPTYLPDELRWLCWNLYPFSSLPVAQLRKLVGLELHFGEIRHLWKGQKILPNLKYVHLKDLHCLTRFPDVSGAPNLERLILSNCCNLVAVHESLGSLRRLVYLDMSNCCRLKYLPSTMEMESLETLILSNCYCLKRFPEVSMYMIKLSSIYLDNCFQIEELPTSIRYLSSLSFLNLTRCTSLKNIPDSVCELKYLKSLHLHDCKELQKLPEEFGSMEKLEDLQLGFTDLPEEFGSMEKLERLSKSINFHTLANLCSLRKLDLSWRQMQDEDFPKNLDGLSFLEELHLSGNSKLIKIPASILHLCRLKHLELNDCKQLQNIQGLPSGIQLLKASNCIALEKIEDLSKEYPWLYKIWFVDCQKLLKDQENERYLHKMLQQSFLKKCAAVDHQLSIAIPGSRIPSWFKEEQHGFEIALKLPPRWHSQIMGIAVCGVFDEKWKMEEVSPWVSFTIENVGKFITEPPEVDCSAETEDETLWIGYIPFGFFQQTFNDFHGQDWSHITEGNLVVRLSLSSGEESVRCGARIMYKEDVETIQQIRSCISDYGKLELLYG